jgi:hypothetical protein
MSVVQAYSRLFRLLYADTARLVHSSIGEGEEGAADAPIELLDSDEECRPRTNRTGPATLSDMALRQIAEIEVSVTACLSDVTMADIPIQLSEDGKSDSRGISKIKH